MLEGHNFMAPAWKIRRSGPPGGWGGRIPLKLQLIMIYGLLLMPSLFVAAGVWSCFAPERLYHCWDDAPFMCFVPPFVHPWADVHEGGKLVQHDYYIWPAAAVYAVWLVITAPAAIIPAIPLWKFWKLWRLNERYYGRTA